MHIETNRCYIKLTREESDFIKTRLAEVAITEKSIVKIITDLYYNSSKRYFRKDHIHEISKNLHEKILLINENVGRNLRNNDNLAGNNSANITDSDILNKKDIVNAEVGVCANSNSDIVTLFFKDRENKIIYFDSPDSAEMYIKQLRYKNL